MSKSIRAFALGIALLAATAAAGSFQQLAEHQLGAALTDGLGPVDEGHLVLGFLWRRQLADRQWLRQALDRLSAAQPMDPLLADEVRSLRARVAWADGRQDLARELFRTMGGLERWWVAGPVPVEELEDFPSVAKPPQAGAEWRSAAGTDPLGWVRISGLAWPAERQMVYLATTVESDKDRPVAVRLGAAQAARLWVNGVERLTTPEPLARGEDQFAAGARLRRGANLIVAAVATERGSWWLRVRLTRPDGGVLTGVRSTGARPVAVTGAGGTAPAVRALGAEIERAKAAGRPGAALAWAAYLVSHRPAAKGLGSARQACRDARRENPVQARLLETLVTDEPGALRDLLGEALDLDPTLAPARLALARWYHERDLDEEAHRALALGASVPALRAADLDISSDLWGPVALPELRALVAAHPRCLDASLIWTRRAMDAGRWKEAGDGLARLQALAPGLPVTRALERRRATTWGDGATLQRLAKERLAEDPNRPGARVRLARLFLAGGDVARAAAVLDEGLRRCPSQVDLLAEAVRVAHLRGDDVRAKRLVARLLELRPQDRRAQRFEKLLGAATEDETWRRTPEELRRMATKVGVEEGSITLLDHHEVRFLPGNLTEERVQRVIRVGDPERADALRRQTVGYVPERERLRMLAARVLRAGGGESSAEQSDTSRLSDPAFNMYYDSRLRVVRYPEVEKGDLLELTYMLSETAEANETGPYKGGMVVIPNGVPVVRAEIELSGKKGAIPKWELANLTGAPRRTVDDDGTVHLSWTWTDLPETSGDIPGGPPLLVTPYLAYSNHPDWRDLGDWYGRHVAPRIRASRMVEDKAQELTQGLKERRRRIAALYHFVTDRIRYVALEFGEHRFRPFSADWVISHRMGDCKDKAALLVALCHAVGIRARMVLVRTADQGPVAAKLGVLEDFNHAIAYLPDDGLWLDGTATGFDAFRPPGADQDAWVLVVRGRRSRPETTPVVGAGVSASEIRIGRSEEGSLTVAVKVATTGDAAASLRSAFAGTQDRQRFARWLQRLFPGARLEGEPHASMPAGRDPATFDLEGRVPRTALLGAGGVPLFPGKLRLLSRIAPAGRRTSPLLVPLRPDLKWTVEVDLGRPPGELPEPVRESGPFGTLDVAVKPLAAGYRIAGSFHLVSGVLPPGRVAGLRAFLLKAEHAFAERLEVP